MSDHVQIELYPSGQILEVPRGTALQDILFPHGVEFPCGGRGKCGGCRVRFVSTPPAPTASELGKLDPAQVAVGWRLACCCAAKEDTQLELAQWETPILADDSSFAFVPQEGYGIAIDLGSTTVAAQLVNLANGFVQGVATSLNPQAQLGADIMTRIELAVRGGMRETMSQLIRQHLGGMITELARAHPGTAVQLRRIVIVGNTVMHHLFSNIDVTPLAAYPFESAHLGLGRFTGEWLGLEIDPSPAIYFLPCFGGFVGSDVLAGILATRLHEQPGLQCLIDLGTNGEIVVAKNGQLLCASTAAGPAFEGARISMGMRASTGAIYEVRPETNALQCRVLGRAPPRGICGSGLVDAVAAALDLGWIEPGGRLADGRKTLPLLPPVCLTLGDIRELQLAKGAIAAGVQLLLRQVGAVESDVDRIYLAGAFGNYVNRTSARRIGMWNFARTRAQASGNTALLGAKMALFTPEAGLEYEAIRSRVRHVGLSRDPSFEECFVDCLRFPNRIDVAV